MEAVSMKSKKNKNSELKHLTYYIAFVIFVLYSITLLLPLLFVLLNSFKGAREFFYSPIALPQVWTFASYIRIFNDKNIDFSIINMFANSLIISLGSTFAMVISSSLAAYVLTKYDFIGKKLIYTIAIVVMIVPTAGSLSALYRLMADTKLLNTHIGVITLSLGGFGMNFFLLYGYFKSVSWSYAEAGQIEGANKFQIFYKIMLPQAIPAMLAVAIISFINNWNDFQTAYLFLRGHMTLAVGIQKIAESLTYGNSGGNEYTSQDYPTLFAAMVFSIIPTITIFSIFQKRIIQNTSAGGLKG